MFKGSRAFLLLGSVLIVLAVAGLVLLLLGRLPSWAAYIGMLLLVLGGISVGSALYLQTRDRHQERLRRAGMPATARVIRLTTSDQGDAASMAALATCTFELEVEIEGQAPYRVRHRQELPRAVYSQISKGMVLPVKVDPSDPRRIVLA